MISLKQGAWRPELPAGRTPYLIAALLALGLGVTATKLAHKPQVVPAGVAQTQPHLKSVTALGRLEPDGEVISVAPATSGDGSRVEELRVQVGDPVKKGSVIAVLNSQKRLQAALSQAQAQEKIARAKLAQVAAGAKSGEIQAQRSEVARIEAERTGDLNTQAAVVARLEAELAGDENTQAAAIARLQAEVANARSEAGRYDQLYSQGAVSESLRDSKRLVAQTAQKQVEEAEAALARTRSAKAQQITEAKAALERSQASRADQADSAKATLDRIAEVRPVDLDTAEAEVAQAQAAVEKAQADLDQSYVRAPQDGTILKIYTRPGEKIAAEGIVDLGRTQQMMAVVEVYESDVRYIHNGQAVTILSDALGGDTAIAQAAKPGHAPVDPKAPATPEASPAPAPAAPSELKGRVVEIGRKVLRQNVVNTDTTVNTDSRVVEVRIRLEPESSQRVAQLTNSQVTAKIQVE